MEDTSFAVLSPLVTLCLCNRVNLTKKQFMYFYLNKRSCLKQASVLCGVIPKTHWLKIIVYQVFCLFLVCFRLAWLFETVSCVAMADQELAI